MHVFQLEGMLPKMLARFMKLPVFGTTKEHFKLQVVHKLFKLTVFTFICAVFEKRYLQYVILEASEKARAHIVGIFIAFDALHV